jgi:hypothetical protein
MDYLGRHPCEFGDQEDTVIANLFAWAEIEEPPIRNLRITGLF